MPMPIRKLRNDQMMRSLGRSESGAVGLIFGLALVPMVGLAGVAIDYNRMSNTRASMQSAADAATLAAARMPVSATLAERNQVAKAVFSANLSQVSDANPGAGTLTRVADGHFRYEASAEVPNQLMRVLGISSSNISVASEAAQGTTAVSGQAEFVVAFDITNSMFSSQAEYDTAIATMQEFVTNMFKGASAGSVVGTVMPFSDRVRLHDGAGAWASGSKPSGWHGCLDVREQTVSGRIQTLTDDPPSVASFKYFKNRPSSAPGGYSYTFDCFGERATVAQVVPGLLVPALKDMGGGGTGRPDEGMAWAWRMLSPRWKNQWARANYPADYGTGRKLAVYVTDGRTEAYRYEVLPTGGPAVVYGGNMGSKRGFDNLEDVCSRMKAAGIEVAIVQLTGNNNATPHLQRCASASRHFMINSVNDFKAAFKTIAEEGTTTTAVRLVR